MQLRWLPIQSNGSAVRRDHLEDHPRDGCPRLGETRSQDPLLPEHVIALAQVEAEASGVRGYHGCVSRGANRCRSVCLVDEQSLSSLDSVIPGSASARLLEGLGKPE